MSSRPLPRLVPFISTAVTSPSFVTSRPSFVSPQAKKEKPGHPTDSRMWLVVAAHDTKVDMVSLASKLGYGKIVIRFDSAESLAENLGVAPGNVSPLALANDAALRVQVALDARLVSGSECVWVHPLTNEASVPLAPAQLTAFIAATGHAVTVVDFS